MTTSEQLTPEAAQALLKWYAMAGVSVAVSDSPINRYTKDQAGRDGPTAPLLADASLEAPRRTFSKPRAQIADSTEAIVSAAEKAARSCNSLAELASALQNFDGCALKKTAKNLVFADGNPTSSVVLVGEAPGRDEDLQGRPFVGRSGHLLDRMLASIGLDRTSTYITNILPYRPPGNRNPTPEETAACLPFLTRHLELVNPMIMIALGGVSAKQLLDTTDGIMRLRGKWRTVEVGQRGPIPLLPMFHPAYLLRQPGQKKLAWRDLISFRDKLDEIENKQVSR